MYFIPRWTVTGYGNVRLKLIFLWIYPLQMVSVHLKGIQPIYYFHSAFMHIE